MASNKYKVDWYQTATQVVIAIVKRGLFLENCRTHYNPQTRQLQVQYNDELIFSAIMFRPISIEKKSISCTPSKVEVCVEKLTDERWVDLYATPENLQNSAESSIKTNNWDQLAKKVEKEEEADESNGVDKLFQRIYRDADDDVKKAMMKSFSESCGTVLSTNWSDIKNKKTEVKPPDDMEFRSYES